jgi:hypothetical protein
MLGVELIFDRVPIRSSLPAQREGTALPGIIFPLPLGAWGEIRWQQPRRPR